MSQQLIEATPDKLSSTPVFFGTAVPIQNLFDCLEQFSYGGTERAIVERRSKTFARSKTAAQRI
ncbi:MAG: hypothetical protein HY231_24320 [Acidobacteria bacterium]|nr:hypothetical protein [Acidobacteriota bacterium]